MAKNRLETPDSGLGLRHSFCILLSAFVFPLGFGAWGLGCFAPKWYSFCPKSAKNTPKNSLKYLLPRGRLFPINAQTCTENGARVNRFYPLEVHQLDRKQS